MATRYALQQKNVADGAKIPAYKADAREVLGHRLTLIASKDGGTDAWNSGDVVYLGRKPAGFKITSVVVNFDTSLGTSTVSIGTGGDPRQGGTVTSAAAYVNAATNTVTDKPTVIGPKASTSDDAPGDEEHLWATIGTANIAAAVIGSIIIGMEGNA